MFLRANQQRLYSSHIYTYCRETDHDGLKGDKMILASRGTDVKRRAGKDHICRVISWLFIQARAIARQLNHDLFEHSLVSYLLLPLQRRLGRNLIRIRDLTNRRSGRVHNRLPMSGTSIAGMLPCLTLKELVVQWPVNAVRFFQHPLYFSQTAPTPRHDWFPDLVAHTRSYPCVSAFPY